MGKAIVFGLLERETGKVCTSARSHAAQRQDLHSHRCARMSSPGTALYTDALKSYDGLDQYTHKVVDHAEALR